MYFHEIAKWLASLPSQSVLWKFFFTAFKVKVTLRSTCQCLSRWYHLNWQTFFFFLPNLVLWCIIMSQSACRKSGVLFSRLRPQQGLIWSKCDSFYFFFCTADPFATKLSLIVHYHEPGCLMRKLDFCVQGQGHSKISKCSWMFFQMIPSELLNLLRPNLVWWCIIISQIVFQKDWFVVFKVKVTVKDRKSKYDFLIYLLDCWSTCN